ncbi:hypothetical protein EMN47_05635 [Prolixibacteraceae bacterium JC049]|nr:hypothetical protein [Prolixibacteraceae bacterium JC049]
MRNPLIGLFVAVLLVFTSCKDNDPLKPRTLSKRLKAEVVLMVKAKNEKPVYAANFYMYCSMAMKQGKVTNPDNTSELSMKKGDEKGMRCVRIAEDGDYTTKLPQLGKYQFQANVTKKNITIKNIDELYGDKLGLIKPKAIAVNKDKLNVTWDLLKDADAYRIKLFSSEGKLLFRSPVLKNKDKVFAFNKHSRGWMAVEKATKGKKYKMELSAIRFEKAFKTKSDRGFNVQCISFCEKEITWELN